MKEKKTTKKRRQEEVIEKIASLIEKRLSKLPAAVRDAKLGEIHSIASTASRFPSEKVSGLPRTQESRLLARPHEES